MSEGDVRILPQNDLDFTMLTTNSVWGKEEVPHELRERLSRYFNTGQVDEKGRPLFQKKELWGLLGFFTRDLRLGNLSTQEIEYCQFYLNLANDYLEEEMVRPFLIALSRAASRLELSQSKAGFLRRQLNTLIQEKHTTESKKKDRTLFGFGGNKK